MNSFSWRCLAVIIFAVAAAPFIAGRAAAGDKYTFQKTAVGRSGATAFDIVPGIGDDELVGGEFSETALSLLRSAQVCLQFGIAGHGNVESFVAAEETLDLAEKEVRAGKQNAPGALVVIQTLREHCAALRRQAKRTLFGKFPLIREFGVDTDTTDDEQRVKSFSVAGAAERNAIHSALSQAVKSAGSGPLSVVVGVPESEMKNEEDRQFAELATSEARTLFSKFPAAKWFPANWATSEQGLPAWDAPDPAFDPICRKVLRREPKGKLARSVMIVLVREWGGPQEGDYWVQAQQRLYESSSLEKGEDKPAKLEADKVVLSESLAHDRSGYSPYVLIVSLVLLCAAIWLHGQGVARLSAINLNWHQKLLVPAFGFALGIGLPALIVSALQRTLPEPTSSAITSAWWPFLAGGLALVLPTGVFRLILGSFGRFVPEASCQGHWGVSFVPVALGAAAAWLHPAWSALGWNGTLPMIPLILAAVGIDYVFGRAIDTVDEFPMMIFPLALIWAGLFGLGAFMGSTWLLGLVAALAWVTLFAPSRLRMGVQEQTRATPLLAPGSNNGKLPRKLEELALACQNPAYQPPPEFTRIAAAAGPLENGVISWIRVFGPSASGKTAAAMQLVQQLRDKHPNLKVLWGTCHEEAQPYQVFHDALAELGIAAGLAASSAHGGEVDTVIERLADEFIPLWSYISDYEAADEATAGTRGDLPVLVVGTLLSLAKQRPVVLCLDGTQWIDESSAAILKHLREHLPPGEAGAIAILTTSRNVPEAVEDTPPQASDITLPLPNQQAQMNILQTSLGIEPHSAARIVEALGVMGQEPGGLLWLFRSVQSLVEEKAFRPTPLGFQLAEQYMQGDRLPVPTSMREQLLTALKATGPDRELLECAALLGERFNVDDVAHVLQRDRLDVLRLLRRLEQEYKLVRDVPHHADRYAFSSAFLYRVVRESLETNSAVKGAKPTPGKIAAELHARIAQMYQAREKKESPVTYAIARHYAEAGPRYARQALDCGLQAAEVALRLRAFGEARKFLNMAAGPAKHFGETDRCQQLSDRINAVEKATVARTG